MFRISAHGRGPHFYNGRLPSEKMKGQSGTQAPSEDKQKEAQADGEMQRQAAAGAALASIKAEEEKMAKLKAEK